MKLLIIFVFAFVFLSTTTAFAQITSDGFGQSNDNLVILTTNLGSITIEFFPDDAPNHVDNFISLTESGFYDGTIFHRIIPGFMIQGGDPNTIDGDENTWGTGGPNTSVDAEFNSIKHNRGIVSMARSADPNSAGSQFFIVHKDSNFLDEQYTVFGRIVTEESFQALDRITSLEIGNRDIPVDIELVKIIDAKVVNRSHISNLLQLPEPERTNVLIPESVPPQIPDWVKNIFEWYSTDQVSEDELLNAIKFLINNEILVGVSVPESSTGTIYTLNGSPILGNPYAPITLVEFGDYQCHFCNVFFHSTEEQIIQNYVKTGKVKMIFKDFNIIGPDSTAASHGAHCAEEQGMFWEYHDVLYNNWTGENNGWASSENLLKFAKDIGLDTDRWSECMANGTYSQIILASNNDAEDLDLTGTPAFFIIGSDGTTTPLFGAQPFESFKQVIDSKLPPNIPEWIKNIFSWYAQEQVSETELLNAITFLINEGTLVVNTQFSDDLESDSTEHFNECKNNDFSTYDCQKYCDRINTEVSGIYSDSCK